VHALAPVLAPAQRDHVDPLGDLPRGGGVAEILDMRPTSHLTSAPCGG
jgi:hypothetical protein